jgi:sporulation protein YhbH
MSATVSLGLQDWSLHRKGPKDQARHQEKVREVIKGNLGDIISNESIITSNGDKIVKVPIRSLEEYSFRFDPFKKDGVGQGPGDSQPGDVIGTLPGQEPGKGRQAGNEPGIDYYEAEFTIDELAEMVFADLGLPNLKDKGQREIPSEKVIFNDVRRTGIIPNLDKKRTVYQAIKRSVLQGQGGRIGAGSIKRDDMRYRTWNETTEMQRNAVVIAMRDVSGSMGEFEKYISRSFYFWMVRFLRTKYTNVDIIFITHHTEAKEVDEETFFNLGESGGTRVSSAYRLCLEIIEGRYNPTLWNIYPFHFSDGDNWGDEDNRTCVELVKRIITHANLFGYGEIKEEPYSRWATSTLMSAFSAITAPEFVGITIKSKEDVYPALKRFFAKDAVSAQPTGVRG